MKLIPLVVVALITLSSTASAGWFEGIDFANINSQTNANTSRWGEGNGAVTTDGLTQANGWGAAKGDTEAEVVFSMNLKAKGNTSIDSQMSADAQGEVKNNALADFASAGNSAGNILTSGSVSNNTSAKGVFPPSSIAPIFPTAPASTATTRVPFAPAVPQVNNTLYVPNNS